MTLKQNQRYRCDITLTGFFEVHVSNSSIRTMFEHEGFADVVVYGQGESRTARGMWPGTNKEKELPSQVTNVTEEGPTPP